ncbi:MAG: hypothetical protein WDM70_02830 [Nitrosomonadales bacterium]
MSFPHFQFNLSSPYNSGNGYITLGDEKIYHIKDSNEFYRSLGYTDEMMKAGVLPEEFIWSEYRRDDRIKSDVCLQVKIIEYLTKHSATFKEQYAVQCENWLAHCVEKRISGASQCNVCNMRASQN